MVTRVPLLLVGDGPHEPTGLGRIARDLAGLLTASDLPLDLVQVGGQIPPPFLGGWRHYPINPSNEDWGASQVERYWRECFGDRPGILFIVWDPSRLVSYAQTSLPVQKWCYTAIDAANVNGHIAGPAGNALRSFDRVLAYGRWASERLQESLGGRPISYLPHGLVLATYTEEATAEEAAWVQAALGPYVGRATLLGCVATNQPRKDLSLFFGTLRELRRRGRNVYGWLHTDVLVKAWSVQQLAEDFDLQRRVTVTGWNGDLTDRQMALLYQRCDLTLGVGLGEGFGYPLVESLASGVPVVHGDSGGGAELLPKTEWRVPVREHRVESVYALERPVFRVEDWANAVERALAWREAAGQEVARAYCRGAVAHLDWASLWPRWRSWVAAGLQ